MIGMNFRIIKENANKLLSSQLFWIQVCAVGIWLLVIQNFFGSEGLAQSIYASAELYGL